ncbi:MAG: cytochrome c oxidase subunit 3 [Saprospiraceae bacterium]|nr:cytochrome c oxidase subunit 3 [Saprospiraceae bacterium]
MSTVTMENEKRKGINPQKFALWLSMGSIIMMFTGWTSAYIVKHAAGNWLEFGLPNMFYISTGVIVLSSIALHTSYISYKKQWEKMYKGMLVLTFVLGIVFIVTQTQGWYELFAMGVDFKANVAGSFTYLITWAHAVHVLGGIATLIVAMIHAFSLKFRYREERKNRFELVLQYWHFVGVLWIYLLFFILNIR